MASSKNIIQVEPIYAKNKAELARILDITRVTLDAWIKLPASPRTLSNGRRVIAEWRVFAAGRKIDRQSEEREELKMQKLRDDSARSQMELMKEAGELFPIEWHLQIIEHYAISVRGIIEHAEIDEHEKLEIFAQVKAINCDEYLNRLQAGIEADLDQRQPQGEESGLAEIPATA